MEIRKAVERDLTAIDKIYARARAFMRATTQWGDNHPSEAQIAANIDDGSCYVICGDGEIVGVFMFVLGEDATYRRIYGGKWLNDLPYGTIHGLASAGKQRGIFNAAVDFCRAVCANVRVDTHSDNKIMQHLIEKYGFVHCGIIYVADGSPRIAYQIE